MSNAQTSHSKLFSRIGLAFSGLVVIAATSLPVASASAQALLVKFDGKDFDLKRRNSGGENNGNGNGNGNGGDRKFQQITIGKGEREAEKSNKKQVPVIEIGKGDRNEDGAKKKASPRILIGKGDRNEDAGKTKTQQIVVGKGDRDKDEGKVVKRQIIVEKAKPKKIVQAEPVIIPSVKKKKKVVLADKPAKKILVAATPEPEVEAAAEETQVEVAPEQAIEAPVEEQVVTEEAPAATVSAFKVGQVVTGGDGNSYVIVKIDDTGISAMPLTAFTQYEEPKPVYKPVYKKRKAKKRYSSYRTYGGSSCH